MSAVDERADSLGWWMTGAASHGAAQGNPDLCLGGFVSSSEFSNGMVQALDPFPVVGADFTIHNVSGLNGAGTGILTATGASTFTWTPPGGTAGAAVTISNGSYAILEGGGVGGEGKFIEVQRNSATAGTGSANVECFIVQHNAISLDKVTSAEAAAGDTEYRCVAIKNKSASAIDSLGVKVGIQGTQQTTNTTQLGASGAGTIVTSGNFNDWASKGWALIKNSGGTLTEIIYYSSRTPTTLTVPANGRGRLGTSAVAGAATDVIVNLCGGIAIGLDTTAAGLTPGLVTIANESTAPSGVTFSVPVTDATALSIGTLSSGHYKGIWIKRDIIVGTQSDPAMLVAVDTFFDAA